MRNEGFPFRKKVLSLHTVGLLFFGLHWFTVCVYAQRRESRVQHTRPPRRNIQTLRAGFHPDPMVFSYTLIGPERLVDVSLSNLTDAITTQPCPRMMVSARPDLTFVVHPSLTRFLLRLWLSPQNTVDAALLIRTPDGRYRCNDDHRRSGWSHPQWPVIDLPVPLAGRYYVWFGTVENPRISRGSLTITTQPNQHP